MNSARRILVLVVASAVAAGFAWLSVPLATLAFATGAADAQTAVRVGRALAHALVAWIALGLARATCELVGGRVRRSLRLLLPLLALALGAFALPQTPSPELFALLLGGLGVVLAATTEAAPDATIHLRFRWLLAGLLGPSLLVFATCSGLSGVAAGAVSVIVLNGTCPWLTPAAALAVLISRRGPSSSAERAPARRG